MCYFFRFFYRAGSWKWANYIAQLPQQSGQICPCWLAETKTNVKYIFATIIIVLFLISLCFKLLKFLNVFCKYVNIINIRTKFCMKSQLIVVSRGKIYTKSHKIKKKTAKNKKWNTNYLKISLILLLNFFFLLNFIKLITHD